MAQYDALDDAAAAALWSIRHASRENIGLLYSDPLQHSPPVSGRESTVRGRFTIPTGSLRGLYHNHTPSPNRAHFSDDDKMMAKQRDVPSYLSAGEPIFRYDPSTGKTEEVLAQLPLDEIRRLYLADGLKR